jgi:hypothetical protein
MNKLSISRSAVQSAASVTHSKTGEMISSGLNKWAGNQIIEAVVKNKALEINEGDTVNFTGTVLRVGKPLESTLINEETGELLMNTSVTLCAINNKAIPLAQSLIDAGNFAEAFDALMVRGTVLNAPAELSKECILTAKVTAAVGETKEGNAYDGIVLNFKVLNIVQPATVNHAVKAEILD